MEIIASPLDWTQFDEERWNSFLNTDTGKRLIPKVLEAAPGLLASGDTNAILIRSGEHRGLQLAVTQLLAMAHASGERPAEVVSDAYPALDNDKAWADGQTLEEIPKPQTDIV